jgi:hypothetical protein
VLAAQAPATLPPDIEQRLRALEGLVRRGPGNTTQMTAPFEVLSADGKPIVRVGGIQDTRVPVSIGSIPQGGGIITIAAGGVAQAVMSATQGRGEFNALDAKQVTRAALVGTGHILVYDPTGQQLAGVTQGDPAGGRIAIWRGRNKAVDITSSGSGAGAISVMNAAGQPVAGLVGSLPRGGAVVVNNSGGVGLAQMSVSDDGRGLVQVFGRAQKPIAVLTEALEYPGGLLQISNMAGPVASVAAADGGGYFQLTNASGLPTVEAGTRKDGRGTVRVGPQYLCNPVRPATPVIGIPGFEDCLVGFVGGN